MNEIKEFKIYNVYVKYVEITIDDGDILLYEAYSPFPRGHTIEKQLVKLSLKDATVKINAMDDSDGLMLDYHGSTAYAPSTVVKIKWSADEDIAKGVYLIDITGSKEAYEPGSIIKVGDKSYSCVKVIDWAANLGTKFLYCTEYIVPKEVKPKVEVKDIKE